MSLVHLSVNSFLSILYSRGRFSVVKKCDQKGTKRAVATKFVNKKLMKRDQVTHELGVMQNLQHPQLIGLLDTFESSTNYILVLEMCVDHNVICKIQPMQLTFQGFYSGLWIRNFKVSQKFEDT